MMMSRKPLLLLFLLSATIVVVSNYIYSKEIQHALQQNNDDYQRFDYLASRDPQTKDRLNYRNAHGKDKKKYRQQRDSAENAATIAGLSCEKYGGPLSAIASEMVYWRDIPSDKSYLSPFLSTGPKPKYLTFEPDEGGWNNIRMSMETAVVMAHAMGRVLVLPPQQRMYLLNKNKDKEKNKFTFKDFFPFDAIQEKFPSFEVITFEEFLEKEALSGQLRDQNTGKPSFPPGNRTNWDSNKKPRSLSLWPWMRSVALNSPWFFDDCFVAFPGDDSPGGISRILNLYSKTSGEDSARTRIDSYHGRPTPVNASPDARMKEMIGHRKGVCVYDDAMQDAKVIHLMGDTASGARLLVHFYLFLFFEDWHQDLWSKRFVRDHLRYVDEIQCAAARVVEAIRNMSSKETRLGGIFDSMHIRRGDFQYKQTRLSAERIYQNTKDLLQENSTIYIATDEKNRSFFKPLQAHYNLLFLDDFKHQIQGVNRNFFGMIDQLVASRSRTFFGAYFSTFTAYINRLRGYHSQKDRLPGFDTGVINSFYYTDIKSKDAMRQYVAVHPPMWAREFPVGWRDLDHDVLPSLQNP